jgi:AraC-like DNA-binding protein
MYLLMFKLFLLLNPVYVTLFWCLALIRNNVSGNSPKNFLGKFMGVLFLLYLSHLFYYLPLPEAYHFADTFYHLCNLLCFPMYYIYIRLLTVDEHFSFRKHGLFLLPSVLLFVLYGVGVLLMSQAEHLDYLYRLMLSDERLSGIFLYQKIIYNVCRTVFVVQGFLYMLLSYRLVVQNKDKVQNYYANTEDDTLNKVHWLNISLIITMSCGMILSALGKENFVSGDRKLIAPSIIFSIMHFFIGWLGNKQRQLLTETREDETDGSAEPKAEKEEMSKMQSAQIRRKLKHHFEDQKMYLNKDLTIWEVSRIIGTNRTYISAIINNSFKQNFSSFVNTYRVKHAKMLQTENPDIDPKDLAEKSGFGSVLSMKRAFDSLDS